MSDLIDRIVAAEGPSRELDAEIAGTDADTAMWHSEDETPAYTSSIDAAMTLVPEGMSWEIGYYKEGENTPPPGNVARVTNDCLGDGPGWEEYERYPTPALAICVAALRARAAQS